MDNHKSKYRIFEGHETWANALRMGMKMHVRIIIICAFFFTVLCTVYLLRTADGYGIPFRQLKLKDLILIGSTADYIKLFVSVFAFYPMSLFFFRGRAKEQSGKHYIRGARLITSEAFMKRVKRTPCYFTLGSIRMPVDLENRGTVIIGKPGTGKTQCMRQILKGIIEKKGQGIIHDSKGEYLTEFYDPHRDLIFNPLDSRSLGWNLFNDLATYMDVDAQAASLIPPTISSSDPFWNDAARGVYAGCLHYLFQKDLRSNYHLWRLLTAEAIEIAQALHQTKGGEAGYRYITQNAENSRQAESVLAVMMQYTRCFEYMAEIDGDFSITEWLKKGSGLIFVTNYEDISETLRPILSLFIDLLSKKLLSLEDRLNRRIYLLLDEFGSLQRLISIVNMITKGRSKGGSLFIGIQDDGQMEKTYGRQLLRTLDNAPGNRITFALSGETAEREAKYNIGETEYIEIERSQSMGPHDMRDGISLRDTRRKEPLFLPSDISNLPDLSAIVKLRGYDFIISNWKYDRPSPKCAPFELREDLILENITAKQKADIKAAQEAMVVDIQIDD
ncbi:type IV secretion system DNA-binding domain-containing protein [Desulfosarcina cetonica]|uniref:type IV secretion system DNA-binding domain-containing protein n=1 Tax=Desulfosarcina cetonica TaxID=90730 RepID=UPI0006D2608E|nr:type IV secretion system DNA-binding domain-containing protein [Desulfosarcina cetonica]